MPPPASADDLKAAVDSMFRIRAVESPPDASGVRTIWHRGARHAELVSEIDGAGRVTRHEFTLFDEVLRWEQGRGFSSGHVSDAAEVVPDPSLDSARVERIASALIRYAGRDRIIAHLRDLVGARTAGAPVTEPLRVVTGSHPVVEPPPEPPRRNLALIWVGVGLCLVAIALLLIVLWK